VLSQSWPGVAGADVNLRTEPVRVSPWAVAKNSLMPFYETINNTQYLLREADLAVEPSISIGKQ
jgi:hypothetical protein